MVAFPAILLTLAASGGDTALVDFYSDTCPPCRQMASTVEQLAARGYPIRKVNVARESALAARFGVTHVPCFVMTVDGREVDRVVGLASGARLEQMLALGRPRRATTQPPIQLVAAEGRQPPVVPIPAVRSAQPFWDITPSKMGGMVPLEGPPLDSGGGFQPGRPNGSRVPQQPARHPYGQLLAATVRLRVEDPRGHSCGSGTIIDTRRGEALILTCGHLFRDSQGKGGIEVDLFGPTPAERVPARLVHHDLDRDLGLLSIRTPGPVIAARVAPPGYRIHKGAKAINVGCNNGEPPSVRVSQVISLDRFLGPANVEVSGLPVQGRSGGGLFTADGLVIGVCNAAIPTDNEGLYAAVESIHAELDAVQLAYVYREGGNGTPAENALATGTLPAMPRQMPPPSDLVSLTETPRQPAVASTGVSENARNRGMTAQEQATWEEVQRRKNEGAEVIFIIRPRDNPQAQSEIIVLDRASPALLERLSSGRAVAAETANRSWPEAGDSESDWRPRWLQPGYPGQ